MVLRVDMEREITSITDRTKGKISTEVDGTISVQSWHPDRHLHALLHESKDSNASLYNATVLQCCRCAGEAWVDFRLKPGIGGSKGSFKQAKHWCRTMYQATKHHRPGLCVRVFEKSGTGSDTYTATQTKRIYQLLFKERKKIPTKTKQKQSDHSLFPPFGDSLKFFFIKEK